MTTHQIKTHVYLRASTDDQDATRALETINDFVEEHRLTSVEYYVENFSGAKLERPELTRLIAAAKKGDFCWWSP
jgi:DNA invertase Pin-like site-specific DNA recombinase